MKKEFEPRITCPKCGAEYVASEIFLPDKFLGKCKHVDRDFTNKVVDTLGADMNLKENFTCDFCDTNFDVDTTITFKTKINEKYSFNSDYTSERPKRLSLFEE